MRLVSRVVFVVVLAIGFVSPIGAQQPAGGSDATELAKADVAKTGTWAGGLDAVALTMHGPCDVISENPVCHCVTLEGTALKLNRCVDVRVP